MNWRIAGSARLAVALAVITVGSVSSGQSPRIDDKPGTTISDTGTADQEKPTTALGDAAPAKSTAKDIFARPASLTARHLPLSEALIALARSAKMDVQIDADALREIGLDVAQPIDATIESQSLGEAIAELVHWQGHEPAVCRLRGGKIALTTVAADQAYTLARLPAWLKPHYGNGKGLLVRLDDHDDSVIGVTVEGVATDDFVVQLKTLPKLRELYIGTSKGMTPAGVAHLAELPSLEKLSLFHDGSDGAWIGDAAIAAAARIETLRDLSVDLCGTTDEGVKPLLAMKGLARLSLGSEGLLRDQALASIGQLKRLRALDLHNSGSAQFGKMYFTADGVRQLSGLENLEHLDLRGHSVPVDAMQWPKLKRLELGMDGTGDAGAERIATFRELESLSLAFTPISDDGLKKIAVLPALRHLTLDSNRITDAGIAHLRRLGKLEYIWLRCTWLTDRALGYLAEMKSLERIDLFGNGDLGLRTEPCFSMPGIMQLKVLPNLRTLWLNQVASSGFAELGAMNQLHELSLQGCTVHDFEIHKLEAALPGAIIHRSTGSEVVLGPVAKRRQQIHIWSKY